MLPCVICSYNCCLSDGCNSNKVYSDSRYIKGIFIVWIAICSGFRYEFPNGIKYYFWVKAADRFCNERISDFSAPDSVIPNIVGISNQQNELPRVFALYQNYPNPFNPITTIRYDVPKSTLVTIIVYDMSGREITTLVNEKKDAGSYELIFDASKLASGVYIYKMTAGEFTSMKKLILIK